MELACGDMGVWSLAKAGATTPEVFSSRCLARENVACDGDEALGPDPAQRCDSAAQ